MTRHAGMWEELRTGTDALDRVTALLQRIRRAHPRAGLLEAADLQYWSRVPRPTDSFPQILWFDEDGPAAAVLATDWGDAVALDPIVLPDASPEVVATVLARGLDHVGESGLDTADVVIDRTDTVLRDVLVGRGFVPLDDAPMVVFDAWLATPDRPAVSPLAHGYRLATRVDTTGRPHHLVRRSGPEVESRLRRTSLYRPDLDLLVLDAADRVVAYGLFWADAETGTGLVEPMRTEDAHQGRGLARHLLTAGLDRLADAGMDQVKICFRPDNPTSRHLYTSAGFVPDKLTAVLRGRV